jgi:hypothetical protein
MAEANPQSPGPFTSDGTPTLQQLVDYAVEQLSDPERLKKVETTIANASAKAGAVSEAAIAKTIKYVVTTLAVPVAELIGHTMLAFLKGAEPLNDAMAKLAIDALLGEGLTSGAVSPEIGERIIERLAPPPGPVEPNLDAAKRAITLVAELEVEGWVLGVGSELFSDAIDAFRGAGASLEQVAQLREVIIDIFGGRRIARRALAPIVDDGIVQPAKRWTSQRYRPQLLAVSAAIDAYLRGDWEFDRLAEESSQQGWSDERLQVLVENARKRLSVDEISRTSSSAAR